MLNSRERGRDGERGGASEGTHKQPNNDKVSVFGLAESSSGPVYAHLVVHCVNWRTINASSNNSQHNNNSKNNKQSEYVEQQ